MGRKILFITTDQHFGTAELNFQLQPGLTLTSTTGYYWLKSSSLINGTQTTYAATPLAAENEFRRRDFTQEVRLNSDWDSPLNFTAGDWLSARAIVGIDKGWDKNTWLHPVETRQANVIQERAEGEIRLENPRDMNASVDVSATVTKQLFGINTSTSIGGQYYSKTNEQLVNIGVQKGRATKPGLKIGVCGEHGGDPSSIRFFHEAGLDYVSCSPYRVPIARLAAAQAQLEKPIGD